MSLNCNGITHKIQELTKCVELDNTNIIQLDETRLAPKTELKIPNFQVYRNDRQPQPTQLPNGRTAVPIRREIVHHHVNTLTELHSI